MNPYIENLKSFLSQTPTFRYRDGKSLLEMLHYYYTADNPIDNAVIRCQMDKLNPVYQKLSFEEGTILFNTISDMCAEYEKKAFWEGIQIGARLYTELSELG